MNTEKAKAIKSIKNNPNNPNDGAWHREHSARVKKQEEKKVEAFTEQALIKRERQEEFKRLNSQTIPFSDVDYMRWVHLHPTLTEAQKAKRIKDKQKEIKEREKAEQETNQQGARASKTSAEEKKAKAQLKKQLAYAKKPKDKGYTADRRMSSAHKNVTKRQG